MVFPHARISRRHLPERPFRWLLRTIGRRLARVSTHFFSRYNLICRGRSQDHRYLMVRNQRRHPRVSITDTRVQVTDGCLFATALIDNISLCGICLCNLPEPLYRSVGQLTVFSCDNPGIPILHVQPRWENTGWNGKTIGAAILNGSETWRLFLGHSTAYLKTCNSRPLPRPEK